MLNSFSRPRIEGTFAGERMRAFDVEWGAPPASAGDREQLRRREGRRHPVRRLRDYRRRALLARLSRDATTAKRSTPGSRITKRPIDRSAARVRARRLSARGTAFGRVPRLRHYTRPFGFGTMAIADGIAYGESFETATASAASRGRRRPPRQHRQSSKAADAAPAPPTSAGTARISSTSMCSGIPVESLAVAQSPNTPPLSGLLDFTAGGSGTFDAPRYDVHGARARLLRRGRRHRHRDGRHQHRQRRDGVEAGGGIASPGGLGTRHHRAQRADGRRPLVQRHRYVARPVSSRVRSAALAVSRPPSPAATSAWSASWPTSITSWSTRPSTTRHCGFRLPPAQTPCRSAWRSTGIRCASTDMRLIGDETQLDVTGVDRPAQRADRDARQRRREPRHPAGLRAEHPQHRPGDARRDARRADATRRSSPAR